MEWFNTGSTWANVLVVLFLCDFGLKRSLDFSKPLCLIYKINTSCVLWKWNETMGQKALATWRLLRKSDVLTVKFSKLKYAGVFSSNCSQQTANIIPREGHQAFKVPKVLFLLWEKWKCLGNAYISAEPDAYGRWTRRWCQWCLQSPLELTMPNSVNCCDQESLSHSDKQDNCGHFPPICKISA